MSGPPPSGGFSLFPNTTAGPPRKQTPRPRATTPSQAPEDPPTDSQAPHAVSTDGPWAAEASPPRNGRQTPQQRVHTPVSRPSLDQQGSPSRQPAFDRRREDVEVQRPPPAADIPPRSETAFSQANTLVRSGSTRSRSSIAKRPFPDEPSSSDEPALRSIFPTFNPGVPLNQQDYFPTQTSPTHIPRDVISRALYSPDRPAPSSPPVRSPIISPMSAGSTSQWPPRRPHRDPPVIPATSSAEQARSLWKVSNGWKASASEGRVYCLKMTQEKDAPVYTLSSTSQPFYNLRLDPTSASAYVTLTRHDPSKPYKAPATAAASSASSILSGVVGGGSSKASESKHWQEVLTTTLEEEPRRHRPNDGLVALLYPTAASKMALDRPDDETATMMAERECARLVWDDDSASHFLVHPALATPFCVTIERSPAWSRVEYTLEHHESPQHLAKLTRDGTGTGWLEVDTNIASKIESFFIIDVAVTALILVAAGDEKNARVETFEPPPPPRAHTAGSERRFSLLSKRDDRRTVKKKVKKGRMEELEMDVESQNSSFAKPDLAKAKAKDKLPWPLRAVVAVVTGLLKSVAWILTICFRALAALVRGLARCLGAKGG